MAFPNLNLPWALPLSSMRVQAIDAAKGLHALHARQPPILHLNLTSNNLLVAKDWRVKVRMGCTVPRPRLPHLAPSSR